MWGPGGCPQHPYLAEPRFGSTLNRSEQDAAMQARQAATVLGPDLVSQRLNEAARFGSEMQVQEAARLAAAEANWVMSEHQRRAVQATGVSTPSSITLPHTAPEVVVAKPPTKPATPPARVHIVQRPPVICREDYSLLVPKDKPWEKDEIWKVEYDPAPTSQLGPPRGFTGLGDFFQQVNSRLDRMSWFELLTFQPLAFTTVAPLAIIVLGNLALWPFVVVVTALIGLMLSIYFYWDDEEE